MMKKALALLLAAAMLTFLCGSACAEAAEDRLLIEMSRNLADRLAELYSEKEVVQLSITADDVVEAVVGTAEAWKQPGGIARATVVLVPQASLDAYGEPLLTAMGAPDALIRHFDDYAPRIFSSLASYSNGMYGTVWLAAMSVMSMDDVCVLEGYPAGYAFVLLDNGVFECPMALVTVRIKEDGAAKLYATFVRRTLTTYSYLPEFGQDTESYVRSLLSVLNVEETLPGQDECFGIRLACCQY